MSTCEAEWPSGWEKVGWKDIWSWSSGYCLYQVINYREQLLSRLSNIILRHNYCRLQTMYFSLNWQGQTRSLSYKYWGVTNLYITPCTTLVQRSYSYVHTTHYTYGNMAYLLHPMTSNIRLSDIMTRTKKKANKCLVVEVKRNWF